MKKKYTMLLTALLILILSCTPVMAVTVPAEADAAAAEETVTAQAATGWRKVGSNYRFYYAAGKYYKNCVRKIGGKLFGFNAQGNLCCGWYRIKSMTFYASVKQGAPGVNKGQILTGYRKIGNDYYYLHPQKGGARAGGFITINKKLYYFSTYDGKQRRTKGWFIVNNKMYYVKADGSIATNTTVDGYKIGASGAVADIRGMDKKAQGYSSKTRYLILVNKKNHEINVYHGSKGSWSITRRGMLCTIGKSSTPSPSGHFRLDYKNSRAYGYKDFKGSTAFYATRLTAGNYIHSVLYRKGCRNPYKSSPIDRRLGRSISNSCIRLELENAKYIYQVTPKNTTIIVY